MNSGFTDQHHTVRKQKSGEDVKKTKMFIKWTCIVIHIFNLGGNKNVIMVER